MARPILAAVFESRTMGLERRVGSERLAQLRDYRSSAAVDDVVCVVRRALAAGNGFTKGGLRVRGNVAASYSTTRQLAPS